jgi:hypothetical protein
MNVSEFHLHDSATRYRTITKFVHFQLNDPLLHFFDIEDNHALGPNSRVRPSNVAGLM